MSGAKGEQLPARQRGSTWLRIASLQQDAELLLYMWPAGAAFVGRGSRCTCVPRPELLPTSVFVCSKSRGTNRLLLLLLVPLLPLLLPAHLYTEELNLLWPSSGRQRMWPCDKRQPRGRQCVKRAAWSAAGCCNTENASADEYLRYGLCLELQQYGRQK
jgi:hypothetical protein